MPGCRPTSLGGDDAGAGDGAARGAAPGAPGNAARPSVEPPSGRWRTGLAGAGEQLRLLIGRSATGVAREVIAFGVPLALVCQARLGTGNGEGALILDGQRSASPPVVLVHGFGGSSTSWFALRRALSADGRTVVTFDYPPWGPSVEELADRLTATVEGVLAASGAEKVHLVGHSLGGVIIAQALSGDRLARHVDLVVTLGSPFGGCPWAHLLSPLPLVRAIRATSPLLRRLAAAPPPAGVRWLAFASALDQVVPADRAIPAHRQATCISVDAAGHCGMLLHPEVIARIVAATAARGQGTHPADLRAA